MTNHDDTADQPNTESIRTPEEIIADFQRLRKDRDNQPPEIQKLIDDATTEAELSKMLGDLRAFSPYKPLRLGGRNIIPKKHPMPEINDPDWFNRPGDEPAGGYNLGYFESEHLPIPEITDWFNKSVGNEPPGGYNFGISKGFDEQPPNSQIVPPAATDTPSDTASGEAEKTGDPEN